MEESLDFGSDLGCDGWCIGLSELGKEELEWFIKGVESRSSGEATCVGEWKLFVQVWTDA